MYVCRREGIYSSDHIPLQWKTHLTYVSRAEKIPTATGHILISCALSPNPPPFLFLHMMGLLPRITRSAEIFLIYMI